MWIAVQKVPAVVLPEANIEDPTAKSRKMKISIFTFVTTLTSLIVVGAAAKTGLRGGLDILNFVIVAIMFFAAITMVWLLLFLRRPDHSVAQFDSMFCRFALTGLAHVLSSIATSKEVCHYLFYLCACRH